ncbi:MAG TPA: hypothetical protein VKA34_08150 [Balneolales bacterium]|nr:hypothetical protein [Balneolales bacterium]
MNKLITLCFTILIIVIFAHIAHAQSLPPAMLSKPAQSAPIDGGISIMIFAGGAYAIKKLREK